MIALRAAGEVSGSLPEVVRSLLGRVGLTDEPPTGGSARERWESLLALVELAEEFVAAVPGADLPRFCAELDVRAEAQHPPTVEGVTLASLHASKGLEWDAVFLVGLVEGTMPIQYADGDEAKIEEERRLLYVGVTRAREHIWLSWALARAAGGRKYRRRSRFLYSLVPENHPAARVSGGAQRPPLMKMQVLSVRCGRGAARVAAPVACGTRAGAEGARVRRLHRRHPDGDRGAATHGFGRTRRDLGHRRLQA
jgi:DNA helicase-2/ATP-dependent DNA helicase PcrA